MVEILTWGEVDASTAILDGRDIRVKRGIEIGVKRRICNIGW